MEVNIETIISKIKKLTSSDSIDSTNKLLSNGWVLPEVQEADSGHPTRTYENACYHINAHHM